MIANNNIQPHHLCLPSGGRGAGEPALLAGIKMITQSQERKMITNPKPTVNTGVLNS